jgi:PAS domain S-box-containing protein
MMIAALVVERSRRRRGQERYAMATAAGGVGVWDWNLETNEVNVDPALMSSLGYADGEIANHLDQLSQLMHPDDAAAVLARMRESAEDPYPTSEVEFRMVHRDGGIRWFLSRGSRVRRNGGPAYLTGTYIDITDRKASERKLGEMRVELTRVSRLTALGEFAAALSHEIRQPLASIVTNAKASLRLLGSPAPDLTEIREALLDVADAGNWANEVIQRNRQLFRQRTVQKEPVDVHAVIHEVAVLAETQLQNRRTVLTTDSASPLPAVIGDRIELQQVLLNLIVNGIDATESVDPGPRRIVVSTELVAEGLVKVSVSDNGVGLDGVDMQQMFSLSYTTKANGSGIGLSLSRSIVEAHGGTLWAEPNQDAGATFSFTVPVYRPAVEEAAIAAARSH